MYIDMQPVKNYIQEQLEELREELGKRIEHLEDERVYLERRVDELTVDKAVATRVDEPIGLPQAFKTVVAILKAYQAKPTNSRNTNFAVGDPFFIPRVANDHVIVRYEPDTRSFYIKSLGWQTWQQVTYASEVLSILETI